MDGGDARPRASGVEAMVDDDRRGEERRRSNRDPNRSASRRSGRKGRKYGFEPPYSDEQVRSWLSQSLCTLIFFILGVSFYLETGLEPVRDLLIATGVPVAIGATMWVFLETHNPVDESCFGRMLPDSPRWTRLNYSREHKAKIVGLDHHCAWLNVSIGRSNYLPFYILVMIGAVQFLLQFIIGLLILTLYSREAARVFGSYTIVFDILLAFSELLSCYIGVSYALLGYFHSYLFCRGLSTYDWMVQQRQAHNDEQQRQREEPQRRETAEATDATYAPPPAETDPYLLCIPCLFDSNVVQNAPNATPNERAA